MNWWGIIGFVIPVVMFLLSALDLWKGKLSKHDENTAGYIILISLWLMAWMLWWSAWQ